MINLGQSLYFLEISVHKHLIETGPRITINQQIVVAILSTLSELILASTGVFY